MAPTFIARMRERGLPTEPPQENPAETFERMRAYSAGVLQIAQETHETNQQLVAHNTALQAEVERLTLENSRISRELRVASTYSAHLASKLDSISVIIDAAMEDARKRGVQAGQHVDTPEETAAAREVANGIERLTPDFERTGGVTKLAANRY